MSFRSARNVDRSHNTIPPHSVGHSCACPGPSKDKQLQVSGDLDAKVSEIQNSMPSGPEMHVAVVPRASLRCHRSGLEVGSKLAGVLER